MEKIPVTFTGVRVTALLELYLRWLDSRDRHPILGDETAQQAIDRLDFDFGQFRPLSVGRFAVGVRSRTMDDWIRAFLARTPGAVVLDIGSGFDSRVRRVNPADGHHWYDVDFPDIVEIADRLYGPWPGHTYVGASVTEPGWLDAIPRDRPAIVVADGLLNFLPEHDVRQVLSRIVEHFPSGEIAFNITSPVVRKQRERRPVPLFTKFGIVEQWFPGDPRDVERFHPRLRLAEVGSLGDATLLRRSPLYYRLLTVLIGLVPAWRNAGWIPRYRF
ncbi:class I SAM-dependent methyltransferase [Microbispora corallina]|uniref:O-methyltransferase n=1 Tax=Microbispora corallina TaxID=83302 RepID=A0ABQ4G7Q1_9ACTN|nr:class I SAM-dependent methyltransferase [Microbispora corallina]GIH43079.1 putative O-methyltransferase [Microbispora corallina]